MRSSIWLAALVTLLVTPLLATPAQGAFPGQNGKILAFRIPDAGAPNRDLWTIDPDGTNPVRLTDTPGHERDATWSADGQSIVHESTAGLEDFTVIDAQGAERFRIAVPETGLDPSWSPGGDEIVYSRSFVPTAIRIVRTDGTGDRQVVAAGADEPAWSPNGDRIAFVAGGGGSGGAGLDDIWVVGADGSGLVDLTAGAYPVPYAEFNPQWSPDGTRLLFTGWVEEPDYGPCCRSNRELFSIAADGTDLRRLTHSLLQEFFAVWSPDGTKIAFSASNPDLSGSAGIFVMNADGSGVSQISAWNVQEIDWQPIPPNRPPDCSAVRATPSSLGAPNHRFLTITISGATDPDGDAVELTITGVTQDERVGAPDAVAGPAPNRVRLRAERDPRGDGRVYRIAFVADDGRGGTCTGFATAGVRKGSQAPVDSAPPSYDSFGS